MASPAYNSPALKFEDDDDNNLEIKEDNPPAYGGMEENRYQLYITYSSRQYTPSYLAHFIGDDLGNEWIRNDEIPLEDIKRWFTIKNQPPPTDLWLNSIEDTHLIMNNIQKSLNMRVVAGTGMISATQYDRDFSLVIYLTDEPPRYFKSCSKNSGRLKDYHEANPWKSISIVYSRAFSSTPIDAIALYY